MSLFSNKTVLVTGAAGICGRATLRKLLKDPTTKVVGTIYKNRTVDTINENLKIVKADLTNLETCIELVKGVDAIIHCASFCGGAKKQLDFKVDLVMLNNIMTMNILHAAAKENVSYFGFIGSSTQYPEADYCISEAEINLRKPHEVYKRNGGFKRYHLELIQQLQEITDIKFGVVVPNAVYGPNDTFGEDGHVLPALIVKASQGMNPFEVWGDGNQVREFVHVDDLIDALFFVLENDPSASPYNACTGVATTINELVRLVTEQYGYEPTINHDLSKPVMLPKRRISVEKINKLGWKSSISLKEGLRQTIEWYEKNKDE